MAPLLLPAVIGCLSRRLAQVSGFAALCSPSGAGAWRCVSALAAGTGRIPAFGTPAPIRPALLGQCQRLTCAPSLAGMKTKSALKRRCKDCFFVRRRGRLFVFCKTHPRHKQRQG
uniref:Ribosomal protein n=2 Tax=Denticeps clupeoides TaxID=299321 RepID=A0AAY4E0N1_9TELE